MFPIIPILAWTGGIAAGAQVAGGLVRGAGELVRLRPGNALFEVAGGCVAPLKTACVSLSELGHDVYTAILGPWEKELTIEVEQPRPRARRRSDDLNDVLNGAPTVTAQS